MSITFRVEGTRPPPSVQEVARQQDLQSYVDSGELLPGDDGGWDGAMFAVVDEN